MKLVAADSAAYVASVATAAATDDDNDDEDYEVIIMFTYHSHIGYAAIVNVMLSANVDKNR